MSIFLKLQIKLLEKDRLELREEIIKLKLDKEALKKQFSLNFVVKTSYCHSENARGLRCGTQCLGCDVIERDESQ